MESNASLIINYLPQNMDEQGFQNLFSQFGEIDSVRIMRDRLTGISCCYGFVNYVNEESGLKAFNEMNGFQIHNKSLKVSFCRGSWEKNTILYIYNLPQNISVESLEQMLSPFGTITYLSVPFVQCTQMPRCFAFVRYSKEKEANDALAALDGKMLDNSNCSLPLSIQVQDYKIENPAYYDGLCHGLLLRQQLLRHGPLTGRGPPMGWGQPMGQRGQPFGRGSFRRAPMDWRQRMSRGQPFGRGSFPRAPYRMGNPGQFSYY